MAVGRVGARCIVGPETKSSASDTQSEIKRSKLKELIIKYLITKRKKSPEPRPGAIHTSHGMTGRLAHNIVNEVYVLSGRRRSAHVQTDAVSVPVQSLKLNVVKENVERYKYSSFGVPDFFFRIVVEVQVFDGHTHLKPLF
jgi:hypothetical protein